MDYLYSSVVYLSNEINAIYTKKKREIIIKVLAQILGCERINITL